MPQFPLGLFEGFGYASRRVRYEAGDVFVLVTDGIVEAADGLDAEFGFEGTTRIEKSFQGFP